MERKAQRRSGPRAAAWRLIVIDDHPLVRQGLTATLSSEPDLEVLAEAGGYAEALDAVSHHPADVAIVDLSLGDRGGLELVKQLRSLHPELALLVLSMHDEKLYAERSLRAGARGYVMKQESTDRLVAAIREVARGGLYVSEAMSARLLGRLMGGGRDEGSSSPAAQLSDREIEVFEHLGRGLGTKQIAGKLGLSVKTIETHRETIKDKLGIETASELVHHATQWLLHESGAESE